MRLALERQRAIASVWRTRRVKTDKGVGTAALAAARTAAALVARFAFFPFGFELTPTGPSVTATPPPTSAAPGPPTRTLESTGGLGNCESPTLDKHIIKTQLLFFPQLVRSRAIVKL